MDLPSVTSSVIKCRNAVSSCHPFHILLPLMPLGCHEGQIWCCAAVSKLTTGQTFFHLLASNLFYRYCIIIDGLEPECSTLRCSWCWGDFHTLLFCRVFFFSKRFNYSQSTPETMKKLYELSEVCFFFNTKALALLPQTNSTKAGKLHF